MSWLLKNIGPVLKVTTRPKKSHVLEIVLPVVVLGLVLMSVGAFFLIRRYRSRRISGQGYGIGKSRSQRMGIGKEDANTVALKDLDATCNVPQDDPPAYSAGIHEEVPSSSIPVPLSSPLESPRSDKPNEFRDELRRQEAERG